MTVRIRFALTSLTLVSLLQLALPHSGFSRTINIPFEFNSIQVGINNANNGDTILVQPGRYQENLNTNGRSVVLGSLFLTTGERERILETIIDGGWNGRSAIRITAGEQAQITGFTIENDSSDFGGGVYMRGSSPLISHLIIRNCVTSRNGAGLYATGGATPRIVDVEVRDCYAHYVGGAMSVFGAAAPTLENCLFHHNYSNHVGGALHINGASAYVNNCTFANNAALHNAGAIYLAAGASAFTKNSIFWRNEPDEVWMLPGVQDRRITTSFCDFEGLREKIYAPEDSNLVWIAGNFGADPLFNNPDDGDYSLAEDSPCIDAGDYESSPDLDGTRRDVGSIYRHQAQGGVRVRRVPETYRTIQQAIIASTDGDVVLVQPGTYRENIRTLGRGVTIASRILTTGKSAYRDSTILDGGGRGSVVWVGEGRITPNLIGLTLQNGRGDAGGGVKINGAALLEDLAIRSNQSDRLGGGVFCDANSRVTIRRSIIEENGAESGAGVYAVGSDLSIETTEIRSNAASLTGGGLACYGSSAVIRLTSIVDNSASGDQDGVRAAGLLFDDSEGGFEADIILDHVTVANNYAPVNREWITGGMAIRQSGDPFRVILVNSIFYGNANRDIEASSADRQNLHSVQVSYSDVDRQRIRLGIEGDQDEILDWGAGNFAANPQFVAPGIGDYRLSANSPCIDAGDPADPHDPDGTRPDLGAFYFPQVIERDPMVLEVPGEFYSIQSAIDAARTDDTVLVAPGRYEENLDFNGKTIVVASRFLHSRDPNDIRATIIDGGGRGACVLFNRGEIHTAHLTGFTLTNGSSREGGGIFCFRASPTINYCVIVGNRASDGGGGIYCYGSNSAFNNLTIAYNDGSAGAGGVHLRNASWPHFNSSIIRANSGDEVVFSADRDENRLYVSYCNVEEGEGGVIRNDNGNLVWEEGNFDADPLWIDPERGDFSLDSESPCRDAGDPESPPDLDESRADVGALAFDGRPQGDEFVVSLARGWNLIGSPVQPFDAELPVLWNDLLRDGRLLMVKDQFGRFFWPAQGFGNIPPWDSRSGYLVKVSAEADVTFFGETLAPDLPIPIPRGWSMVSYQPPEPVSPEIGFRGVVAAVQLVKDGLGNFYSPQHNFNNIPVLQRGRGYKLKTTRAAELVWGSGEGRAAPRIAAMTPVTPEYFPAVTPTGADMSMIFDLQAGELPGVREIAAFTTEGLCVGAAVIPVAALPLFASDAPLRIGLAIFADDPTTAEIDGAREGEELTFRFWDGSGEIDLAPEWIEGSGRFAVDGFALGAVGSKNVERLVPQKLRLHPPYPNPFNASTLIRVDLPMTGRATISVFDLSGREVMRFFDGTLAAGVHRVRWGAPALPSGEYLMKLSASGGVSVSRVLLIR